MSSQVLIVEDEFIVANGVRIVLAEAGYKVAGIAASAEEAGEHIRKGRPDIVLLDIRLEGKISGIELARQLRAEHIPFVYLSANSNQTVLEEAKKTEPYGFLIKPFRERDLLVMLEIALYRHNHSLESKLRQEERLLTQLAEIRNKPSDSKIRLLDIATTLQTYIPFDFISLGLRPLSAAQFNDTGYLRIGFDEYQLIGEKELMIIARLDKSALSAIIENSPVDTDAIIYNDEITTQRTDPTTLQKILLDSFKLRSYLVFPVRLSNNEVVHYFFYNKQQGIYTNSHIALLNRLRTYLADAAEQMIRYGNLPLSEVSQPQDVNKKNGDVSTASAFKIIIGKHHILLAALDLAAQVAPYSTSVLILGESGTGKEKVAQAIHALSSRKNGPFIKVNCAAIPAALVESELFGHEKGAFTGAIEKRKGKFELADGGTIFLDEIGELPLDMQVKLLRVLQEKEIEYVGGRSSIKVNVRVIAATNRNLEKEVAAGAFRLDLYYRLNVFPVTLPPLRERKSDLEALTLFFAHRFCQEFNKPFTGIGASMMEEMYAHNWPGNIRELENIVEQAVILNDRTSPLTLKRSLTVITAETAAKTNNKALEYLKHIHKETEREYIISILKKVKGRIRGVNGAAELLNIKPTTLEAQLVKLNISREDFMNAGGDI